MFRILVLALLIAFPVYAGGKPSYSGGSKISTSSAKISTSATKTYTSTGTTKSYSSVGTVATASKSYTAGTKSSFDSLAAKEQTKVESRKTFAQGTAPKTEYKTPSGTTLTIDPKDRKIENLRNQLSHERWVNRESRQQQVFSNYYSRPVVVYNDPYPSVFWWWMLDRSLDERAMWAYHHQHTMDQARYREMLARDAQLEARIKQLEKDGVKRDENYTPKGVDNDLMYSDDYVDAAYNPEGTSSLCSVIFWILCVCCLVFVIWFVFFKEMT